MVKNFILNITSEDGTKSSFSSMDFAQGKVFKIDANTEIDADSITFDGNGKTKVKDELLKVLTKSAQDNKNYSFSIRATDVSDKAQNIRTKVEDKSVYIAALTDYNANKLPKEKIYGDLQDKQVTEYLELLKLGSEEVKHMLEMRKKTTRFDKKSSVFVMSEEFIYSDGVVIKGINVGTETAAQINALSAKSKTSSQLEEEIEDGDYSNKIKGTREQVELNNSSSAVVTQKKWTPTGLEDLKKLKRIVNSLASKGDIGSEPDTQYFRDNPKAFGAVLSNLGYNVNSETNVQEFIPKINKPTEIFKLLEKINKIAPKEEQKKPEKGGRGA
jgi:hypothetical protein